MRIKGVKLEWYVMAHDFNNDKIVPYNIFYNSFPELIHKEIKKKKINNYNELKEYISNWSKYNYWCKAEHEIIVAGLISKGDKEEKIDVDWQIQMNLDRITEYVNNECRLGFQRI